MHVQLKQGRGRCNFSECIAILFVCKVLLLEPIPFHLLCVLPIASPLTVYPVTTHSLQQQQLVLLQLPSHLQLDVLASTAHSVTSVKSVCPITAYLVTSLQQI